MMMGTSLHTLVQMVDNGLGMTIMPEMAIASGLLEHTDITARPLRSERSEEHTSELQSLMRISYAVFCLKKKNKYTKILQDTKDNKPDTPQTTIEHQNLQVSSIE